MRRLSVLFTVSAIVFMLFGCSFSQELTSEIRLPESFKCEMSVKKGEKEYICLFEKEKDDMSLTVASPSELKGLELSFVKGEYICRFGDSDFEADENANIQRHFFGGIVSALSDYEKNTDFICDKRGNGYSFKGKNNLGMYALSFDLNGDLSQIKLFEPSVLIDITDYSAENV